MSTRMEAMYPATKFRPPSVGSRAILRPDLIGMLDTRPQTVVVVRAPAGYGKTTVVTQWIRSGVRATGPTIWVSLDEDDDDVAGLWGAVIAGANFAGVTGLQPNGADDNAVRSSMMVPLLNAFADASTHGILVLDDLHRITSEGTMASLDWFMAHGPENLTIALISRMPPELPALDRLRAHGTVLDLSTEQLRLDRSGIDELLRSLHDLDLTAAELERVEDLTAGWPAAVSLVGSAVERGASLDRIASPRSGGVGGINALVREGLAGSTGEDFELLRRISVLERFDADLLSAVIGDDRAWAVAMDVAERTGLIVALDDEGRWWRMHHLVREGLQADLGRNEPGLRRELHRRAAREMEREHDISATVNHLFGAEDYDAIASILSNVRTTFSVPRQALGLSWLDRIPESVLARNPRLAFYEAWARTTAGDVAQRDKALARGRSAAPTQPIDLFHNWDDVEDFIFGSSCYDDVGRALRAGERFLTRYGLDHPLGQTAGLRYATMLYLDGRCDDALAVLGDLDRGIPLGRPLHLFVPAYQALCHLELGATESAAVAVERCRNARINFGIGADPIYLPSELASARLQTEHGRPELGLATALRSLEIARTVVDVVLIVPYLLVEVARASSALQQVVEASVALAQAEEISSGAVDAGDLPKRIATLRSRLLIERAIVDPRPRLSDRELEVLSLLPTDMTAPEIAAELFISVNTARSHVKSIYRKLHVTSREEAVVAARRAKLIWAG